MGLRRPTNVLKDLADRPLTAAQNFRHGWRLATSAFAKAAGAGLSILYWLEALGAASSGALLARMSVARERDGNNQKFGILC